MNIKPLSVPRSDLAIELAQSLLKQENTCEKSSKTLPEGLSVHTKKHGSVEITCVRITTPAVAQKLQKPRGRYITIQTPPLWNSLLDPQDEINAAADCIRELLPSHGSVLVAGLGNNQITPDALGPAVINRILATRHLKGELAKQTGLDTLRKTSVIAPGVMGQTGIETGEILSALVNFIRPGCSGLFPPWKNHPDFRQRNLSRFRRPEQPEGNQRKNDGNSCDIYRSPHCHRWSYFDR